MLILWNHGSPPLNRLTAKKTLLSSIHVHEGMHLLTLACSYSVSHECVLVFYFIFVCVLFKWPVIGLKWFVYNFASWKGILMNWTEATALVAITSVCKICYGNDLSFAISTLNCCTFFFFFWLKLGSFGLLHTATIALWGTIECSPWICVVTSMLVLGRKPIVYLLRHFNKYTLIAVMLATVFIGGVWKKEGGCPVCRLEWNFFCQFCKLCFTLAVKSTVYCIFCTEMN